MIAAGRKLLCSLIDIIAHMEAVSSLTVLPVFMLLQHVSLGSKRLVERMGRKTLPSIYFNHRIAAHENVFSDFLL